MCASIVFYLSPILGATSGPSQPFFNKNGATLWRAALSLAGSVFLFRYIFRLDPLWAPMGLDFAGFGARCRSSWGSIFNILGGALVLSFRLLLLAEGLMPIGFKSALRATIFYIHCTIDNASTRNIRLPAGPRKSFLFLYLFFAADPFLA